jgi:uncharacterized protein
MKTSRKSIDRFIAEKKIAIAGVSRDPKKFGYTVFTNLRKKGFEVFPVNPGTDVIDTMPCYHSVGDLPPGITALLVLTPRNQTMQVVKEALDKGMNNLWIQQMSETPEVLDYLRDKPVNFVFKQCILMWTEPVSGFHKFHRNLKRFFGALPK